MKNVLRLVAIVFLTANVTSAATFTVNRVADGLTTGGCDAADCSLRDAITAAAAAGADSIAFNIPLPASPTPAPAAFRLTLTFPLPVLPADTTIDGGTQTGGVRIELFGAPPDASFPALQLSSNTTVKGLVINGKFQPAIQIPATSSNVVVQGNYIGTNVAGTAGAGPEQGILSFGSSVTIGGTTAAQRNVLMAEKEVIRIEGGTSVTIQGNYIGVNAAGTAVLVNSHLTTPTTGPEVGLSIQSGGTTISGNVISGGRNFGIQLGGAATVTGNFIGTDATGTAALANGVGIAVTYEGTTKTTIGGTTAAARNVITGNTVAQITITATAPVDITGNYIGVKGDGNGGLPPATPSDGIVVTSGEVVIGGTTAGSGNTISGNSRDGIVLNAAATVAGNIIGRNAGNLNAVPNGRHGIQVAGGNSSITNNVIGSNTSNGIHIEGGDGNTAQTNTIFSNGSNGIAISEGGSANRIAPNAIYTNASLGIDLGADGVTANDAGDPDAGANNLQNFPRLLSATRATGGATVSGVLNSTPSTAFRIDLYFNTACDASGSGEGELPLTFVNVTTDALGNAAFSVPVTSATNGFITATATDPLGNTSEFSLCRPIANAPAAAISIADGSVAEGNSGNVNLSFTLTLSAASAVPVTVDWATVAGTATEDVDFVPSFGVVTFPANQLTQSILVPVVGDVLDEVNQTFTVVLSNAVDATIADGTATGTILDDDATPSLSVNDVSTSELDSGNSTATFTVTIVGASEQPVTVSYQTATGTAGIADFTAASGVFTFNGDTTQQSVNVTVKGDLFDEADETFTLNLSDAVNATISDGTGTGTILDNDAQPQLSIGNASPVTEEFGSTTFVVTLTGPTERTVSVNFTTLDGTAIAGQDYQATSGTLTFAAGVSQQTINVPIVNNFLAEATETFRVLLSNPANATLSDNEGTGTITDADVGAILSIGDASAVEGGVATFLVSLEGSTSGDVTVNYATVDASAAAPGDYVAASGTLTFPAGTTQQSIVVTANEDTLDEVDETFRVVLSNVSANAIIGDAVGNGTIIDNDGMPSLSISGADFAEFGASEFTVTLSEPTGRAVSFRFDTSSGSAIAGEDFHERLDGEVTIFPGKTIVSVPVQIIADDVDESDETFNITLRNADGAVISGASAVGTILDDDLTALLDTFASAVVEGHSGTTSMTFLVTLAGPTDQMVTVNYATGGGNASAGSDYVTTTGSLTFMPGETEKTVSVPVNGDTTDEANETFFLALSDPTNALLNQGTALGTIYDDDGSPTLSIGNASVTEPDSGTAAVTFAVTLQPPSGRDVTVSYITAGGTADLTDFVPVAATLSFAPGETSKNIVLQATGDDAFEADETFFVQLSSPDGAIIGDGIGEGLILNDDAPSANLGITLAPATSSGRVTYTIVVSNTGPAPAAGVTMTDTLGNGTRFETVAAPAGWSCTTPSTSQWGGAVSCTASSLASGASATFTIATRLDCKRGSASNTATAAAATGDPNAANNSASTTVGCP